MQVGATAGRRAQTACGCRHPDHEGGLGVMGKGRGGILGGLPTLSPPLAAWGKSPIHGVPTCEMGGPALIGHMKRFIQREALLNASLAYHFPFVSLLFGVKTP